MVVFFNHILMPPDIYLVVGTNWLGSSPLNLVLNRVRKCLEPSRPEYLHELEDCLFRPR